MKILMVLLLWSLVPSPVWTLCPLNCICQKYNTTCTNIALTEIPTDIDSKVQFLDLSSNKICSIVMLEELNSVRFLNVSSNTLKSIYFRKQEYLENVDLSINTISDLNKIRISTLKNLAILNLSQNPGIFTMKSLRNPKIELLNLSDCKVVKVENNISENMPNIKTLILKNNSNFNNWDFKSNSLKTLDISNCRVTSISSKNLRSTPTLECLIASNNINLKLSLDDNECSSLKYVDVRNTGQSKINIKSLCSLESGDFSFNSVSDIEETSFISNKNLKFLNISYNKIEHIHSNSFARNNQLIVLDLAYNQLDNCHWTQNLTKLLSLNLTHNFISKINVVLLRNLKYLDVSHNKIVSLENIDFSEVLPKLEYLDVSSNEIQYLPTIKSSSIKALYLSNCKLTSILPEKNFRLQSLEYLDLSGNKLIRLDSNVFRQLTKLTNVDLGQNPWLCDCKNEMFHDLYVFLLKNDSLTHSYDLICDKNNVTWTQYCYSVWYPAESRSSAVETFLFVLGFFLCCIFGMGIVIYCKHRNSSRNRPVTAPATITNAPEEETRLSVRRVQSEADINRNGRISEISCDLPPSYEEALLLPTLTELERMTRSMDVLAERGLTPMPPTP